MPANIMQNRNYQNNKRIAINIAKGNKQYNHKLIKKDSWTYQKY